jgi:hypothetical protein
MPNLRREVWADSLLRFCGGGHFRVLQPGPFCRSVHVAVEVSFQSVAMDSMVCSCVQDL